MIKDFSDIFKHLNDLIGEGLLSDAQRASLETERLERDAERIKDLKASSEAEIE